MPQGGNKLAKNSDYHTTTSGFAVTQLRMSPFCKNGAYT